MIKAFRISKLFGKYDIEAKFENNFQLIIGPNGTGKTTILNCLYYILDMKFYDLVNIEFESMELIFSGRGGKKISFTHKTLENFIYILDRTFEKNISIFELTKNMKSTDPFYNISNTFNTRYRYQSLRRQINKHEMMNKVCIKIYETIKQKNISIIYLPTYRRIEVDFEKIKSSNNSFANRTSKREIDELNSLISSDNSLIHFGMKDVQESLKKIVGDIRSATLKGFNSLTTELISLIANENEKDTTLSHQDNNKKIKIVLKRVGIQDDQTIDKVLQRIKNKSLDAMSSNFVSKLVRLYDQHQKHDKQIDDFCTKCNQYLHNKEFVYDQQSVECTIRSEDEEKQELKLEQLSSGEKQLISLFSKIFLDLKDEEKFIIFFDEPELSLSFKWQETILKDIIDSGKCLFLLSVTHSPYIASHLEKHTSNISRFVKS